jgi:hypothetical protein
VDSSPRNQNLHDYQRSPEQRGAIFAFDVVAHNINHPTYATANSIFGIAIDPKTVMMHNHSTSDKNSRDR